MLLCVTLTTHSASSSSSYTSSFLPYRLPPPIFIHWFRSWTFFSMCWYCLFAILHHILV